jgi:S-adenosylmethionine decarboxylase
MSAEQQMHSCGESSDSGDDFAMEERAGSPSLPENALCFEGPEKNLEMHFRTRDTLGCRALTREMLDNICSQAQCCILSKNSNASFDAYILSESSLFVYPGRIVMKTCGTTTLLRCVGSILSHAQSLGLQFVRVLYSRKNFTFPEAQQYPHGSPKDEWSALDHVFTSDPSMQKKKGSPFTVGPMNDDHWLTYVHESPLVNPTILDSVLEVVPNRAVLNVMMFGLDRKVANLFFRSKYAAALPTEEVSKLQTAASGIGDIIPCSSIDAHAFEPCGYSMNGIHADMYQTIHITPEEEGSYASYETVINYGGGAGLPVLESKEAVREYALQLVQKVVGIFKPERLMLTVTDCKQDRDCGKMNVTDVFDDLTSLSECDATKARYSKSFSSQVQMRPKVSCHVSNWSVSC